MSTQVRPFLFRNVRRQLSILVDFEVNNAQERYAIPEEQRTEGFLCRQLNTDEFYILEGGIENQHWRLLDLKSSFINSQQKISDRHFIYPINHQTEITIQHNLQKEPAVQVKNHEGMLCIADVQHIDDNHTTIKTEIPFTGVAIFN